MTGLVRTRDVAAFLAFDQTEPGLMATMELN